MSQTAITFAIYQRGLLLRRETIRRAVIRIGREAQNHLQLPDATVAKRHAAIEVAGPGLVTLVALAAEGVRVNGAWTQEAELQQCARERPQDPRDHEGEHGDAAEEAEDELLPVRTPPLDALVHVQRL